MGGVRRRLAWPLLRSVAVVAAFLGIAAPATAVFPARAAGWAQAEGGTTIDGRYLGPIRWNGEVTIGDSYFECSDYQMELAINTAAPAGPVAGVIIFCPGSWLSRETGSLPLTWDATAVAFQWDLDQGESYGYMAWSGVVTRSGETVTIDGTFAGSWGNDQVQYPYGGTWQVTRVASEVGGTTSTTQPGGAGEEVSTTASSSTTVPSQPATEDGETPGDGQTSAFSLFESGNQRVFPEGNTSAAGVAMLVLVVILVLVAGGMALKDAVAEALGGAMEGAMQGTRARLIREWVSDHRPGPPEPPAPPYGPEGTELTVSGPVQPWSGPDPASPRAGFMLQPGGRYTVVGSTGPGPGHWVLVRDHSGAQGWVHRSTLTTWQVEVPSHWVSAPSGAWEWVRFPERLETRLPDGRVNLYEPGWYQLGPPDAAGYRQVTDLDGRPLSGTIHADRVPPPPGQPTGGLPAAPPPPPS